MKIEVLDSLWGADDETFVNGIHEIPKPSKAFLRLVAGAEAAGAIAVLDATAAELAALGHHVQSQDDGEAALAAAMGEWTDGRWSGDWHDANVAQFELDVRDGTREEGL